VAGAGVLLVLLVDSAAAAAQQRVQRVRKARAPSSQRWLFGYAVLRLLSFVVCMYAM